MSRTQRLAMLAIAAVIAVVAFATLSTNDSSNDSTDAAQTTTTQSTATTPPTPTADEPATTSTTTAQPKPKPKPRPPLLTAANPRQLTFEKGQTARFRVRHGPAEEVHLHGYDISKDLPAGKTMTFSFKANIEGIFEVELEHSGTPLGSIKVEP